MRVIDADWIAIALLSVAALWLIYATFRTPRCPDSDSGRHSWEYEAPGIAGWGTVRCAACKEQDVY